MALASSLIWRLRLAKHRKKTPWLRLGGTTPVSDCFGFDRGKPIDRYYIESFLEKHAGDIRGRVMEIGDDTYTKAFARSAVAHSDVFHVHGGNPDATLVGDLSAPDALPAAAFDCMIITQTLHLIFDMRAAVEQIYCGLKPGGVALVTVPGISQIATDEWGEQWFWSLTPASARRLFGVVFGPDAVEITAYGNVFSATAFLQGLALEEVDRRKLTPVDPSYPVTVAVRATRKVDSIEARSIA